MSARRTGSEARDPAVPRSEEHGHGRSAERPGEIPLRAWPGVLLRVKNELAEDNLSILAAGVAFFSLMALFPGLAAMVSVYGLVADPARVNEQIAALGGVMPGEARTILTDQIRRIAESSSQNLSLAAVVSFLLVLWSAAKGTKAMMAALNVAYEERESRGFLRLNGLAVLLSFFGIVFGIFSLALVIGFPAIVGNWVLRDSEALALALSIARWILLAALVSFALAALYRWGPDRATAALRWVTVGSVTATILWLAASALFSLYVSHFGSYNETYGAIGAVVILLMWLFIGAYVVLLGAELNAEIERQTSVDTTEGEPKPIGERGAAVADSVARSGP